jgi:hypothetical protein
MNLLASIAGDPAMAFLQPGLDAKSATPLLGHALGCGITVTALHAIRHKPGRRCLIEYELAGGDVFVGKVRAKGTPTAVFDLLTRLWHCGFNDGAPDGIRVAQPVALVPELRMMLLRKEPGHPATDLLVGSGGVAVAARLAEVAHKLHNSGLIPIKTHTIGDELDLLDRRLAQASQIHPSWARRIDAIRARCRHLAATLPVSQPTSIHRDFYPAQVLVQANRCCLLDLDLFSLGDPALDLGNFVAHLAELALREHDCADFFSDREQAIVSRYLELNPQVPCEAVQIYRSLTLARHIFISTQFPERGGATERLIGYCERQLY